MWQRLSASDNINAGLFLPEWTAIRERALSSFCYDIQIRIDVLVIVSMFNFIARLDTFSMTARGHANQRVKRDLASMSLVGFFFYLGVFDEVQMTAYTL